MNHYNLTFLILISLVLTQCQTKDLALPKVQQWEEIELEFTSDNNYDNAYTDVEFWVDFTHSDGKNIRRPGFWDGDNTWKVRFASPYEEGTWTYHSYASNAEDSGLNENQGSLLCTSYQGENKLIKHGLLKMSAGHRNVVHADGTPFLMIGDTPWALPWRGTYESVKIYSENRQERGFNTALLMSLMPDRGVDGPHSRVEAGGFDVAFEDLKEGHINEINPDYFLYLDSLQNILINHGIVPVFNPVFHGFGWKGKELLGWDMDEIEYARYCRYLVARYGAKPAMWLVGADSDGRNNGIKEGGEEIQKWDAYQQPTGLHYSPHDDKTPAWLEDFGGQYEPHMNRTHQDAEWLDFQWCQTGHGGEHQTWKVEKMFDNLPTKASANGEPTYEGIGDSTNGAGWWQGNEAWLNFTNGGTMGVVYGAGGLWNWKLTPDETGWADWANSNVSWRGAIELPGSNYVGYLGKALEGLDITDIEKHPELAVGNFCLAKPGELFIIYLPKGGTIEIDQAPEKGTYQWFNPKSGEFVENGKIENSAVSFRSPLENSSVLILKK